MFKEFEKEISKLAKRIEQTKEFTHTEESTKMSFVLPFFKVLGYDYTDPREVVAEFTADINSKNMDKVDYVIMDNGQPAILVECKHWSVKLDSHINQLLKYFVSTSAKFAILTNGIDYFFYTDLETTNILDKTPFLKINMLNLKTHSLKELMKFKKDMFNVNEILTTAEELKYTGSVISLFGKEYNEPSDDFIRHVISNVYSGVKNKAVVEKFRPIVKNSFAQFVNDLISDRLETVLRPEIKEVPTEPLVTETSEVDEEIESVPTEEEIQAFYIVKGILAEETELDLIQYKDTTRYFAVLYDNKVTKWICRLSLSPTSKILILPDALQSEKITLISVSDLYRHKEVLLRSVKRFTNND